MKVNKEKYLDYVRRMGFTQGTFAQEKLGMSRQGMLQLLSRPSVTTNTITKLADAIDIDPKDLLIS